MRYLGIDMGTKKVGISLSDEAGTMGFPRGILQNDERLFDAVRTLIENEKVGAVVIGEPVTESGRDNPVAKESRAFGARLASALNLPVYFELEAYTTQEALREMDGSRGAHRAVDDSAAALILTSYLSRSHD